MRIDLITALMPPRFDAIGQYTTVLAREMAKTDEVRVLTADAACYDTLEKVPVLGAFATGESRSFNRLSTMIGERAPDWIVLQYNPFGYGKWGWNPVLPIVLRNLRRRLPQTRLAVMFHETYVTDNGWKLRLMRQWQRAQVIQLCRAADAAFVSVEAWGEQIVGWLRRPPLHLPVYSMMPRFSGSAAGVRDELGIAPDTFVVGAFGTDHASRMFDLMRDTVVALHRDNHNLLLIDMGPIKGGVIHPPDTVRTLVTGLLDEQDVSRRLAVMDLFLTPFVDGVSTRRSSMMSALQHGLPSVGTTGIHTDSLFRAGDFMLLSPMARPAEFTANALRAMQNRDLRLQTGRAAAAYYDAHFAPPRIWETMRAALA